MKTIATKKYEIIGADYQIHRHPDCQIHDDEKDLDILKNSFIEWSKHEGPQVGDFIKFSDNVLHRFSYRWDNGLQTSKGGSFYFDGGMDFSGGLDPCVPFEKIKNSGYTKMGNVWFFHHGYAQAHSAIKAIIECRVYETELKSTHWHK